MSILAVAVVFPLSLMRNVSSLSPLNAISLGFYGCFIVALIYSIASPSEAEQAPEGAPSSELKWFDPSGFLLTLPIFSLAYTCQFGVFAVYAGLPNPNHKAMNTVINYSIFLASFLYSAVGVFGYIAFSHVDIDGDLLNNFPDGVVFFDILKLGFSISIIFSFPITVYPCRAALNTLIFVPNAPASTTPDVLQSAAAPEPVIPGARFFGLTAGIVFSALIVALAIPEVATILSFTGSTTGTSLAYILPASTFLVLVRAADVKPRLRRIAILILVLGVVCCIGSTALVLYSTNPLPVKEVTNSVDIPIEGDTGVKERDVSSSLNRSISSLSLQSFSRLPSVVSLPISSSAEAGLPPKKSLVNKR
ncbi:hypothetical protein CAOG_02070 [Capsaspora owczarzaki ATCC 30864]|nr:hypothetical protein CAOG_02070 [Capsaspora owczarzaki ATCC 30864]|eukprot:XP_004348820.2 hypothetical protein CAOG_02070 [Capsaspora owczarzaki ATCC 30864]